MKKLFLTLTILFSLMITANAQDVGKMWVGGSVGLSNTSIKVGASKSYLNFKVIPEFGYVINDKMGIGIKLGYQQTKLDLAAALTNEDYVPAKVQGFTVSPFIRYSVLKGNIGGLFIDGGVGYAHSKNKDADFKVNAFEVGFRPGVSLNVSECIALTAKFGFLGYEHSKMGEVKIDNYGFNLDLDQALFGVNFVF